MSEKWLRALVVFCLLPILLGGCQAQFKPGGFTDDMGRVVNLDKMPERIVSHVPSITETLFALGLEDKLVGVCDYCDYPEPAKSKPSVGNYFNPSVEAIVALEPDLVLTDGHSESIKRLGTLDIPYFVLDPKDIDGILKDIELLGRITGKEKNAASLVSQMKQDISEVTKKVTGAPRPRVFYVIDVTNPAMPWTAGLGSFIDALITLGGGENIAAKSESAWLQISIEAVVNADPEVIITTGDAYSNSKVANEIKNNPAWQGLSAVKSGNIRVVEADPVVRSGPRITQGLKIIARAIHPELFK
ncbi:MAG: ABC transporter substrate-binding protein [Chloroflexota bacterium]